jgi:hypothetical protein
VGPLSFANTPSLPPRSQLNFPREIFRLSLNTLLALPPQPPLFAPPFTYTTHPYTFQPPPQPPPAPVSIPTTHNGDHALHYSRRSRSRSLFDSVLSRFLLRGTSLTRFLTCTDQRRRPPLSLLVPTTYHGDGLVTLFQCLRLRRALAAVVFLFLSFLF